MITFLQEWMTGRVEERTIRVSAWRGVRSLILLPLILSSILPLLPTADAQAQSLYADPKARQIGDVLTIVLNERTNAQRSSAFENRSSASMGGDASFSSPNSSGSIGLQSAFDKDTENMNETAQSELLSGTMTARVTALDDAGNLVIEGERHLNVNGITHVMRVSGLVRPLDVRYDNTLYSSLIANAKVEYRRAGLGRRFIKPATFTKIGMLGVLGAAIFFATQ